MSRDDNDRAVAGELPDDPAFDAVPVDRWADPLPLASLQEPLPTFPTDALGELGPFVAGLSDFMQSDPSIAALAVLSAGAAVGAKRARVGLYADRSEPVNLYTCVVAPPSARKSPVWRHVFRPLRDAEERLQRDAAPRVARLQETRSILEGRLKAARRRAVEGDPGATEEATRLAAELGALEPAALPRLIADDVTPERLSGLLQQNAERLAIISDEGSILDLDRYSKVPNFGVLLNAYSGDSVTVDRVGREGERLVEPLLTLALAVQPVVVEAMQADPIKAGRGLPQRFVYAHPESLVGTRTFDPATMPPYPRSEANHYRARLTALAESPLVGRELPMSAGAVRLWADHNEAQEQERRRPGDPLWFPSGHVAEGWIGKSDALLARVAGVLHVLDHGPDGTIERETMDRACRILTWARPHAFKVFGVLPRQEGTKLAERLLSRIRERRCRRFSERDAYRDLLSGETADRARLAIGCLQRTGHVRAVGVRPTSPAIGRPPSPEYEVNPAVWPDGTDRTPEGGR